MIKCRVQGDFKGLTRFLNQDIPSTINKILEKYGKLGVDALSSATPVDTGVTADSWYYEIKKDGKSNVTITWKNSNVNEGIPIVLLLQYGHATRDGGYIQGRDFINPAIRPIFDSISKEVWKEVNNK